MKQSADECGWRDYGLYRNYIRELNDLALMADHDDAGFWNPARWRRLAEIQHFMLIKQMREMGYL